MKLGLFGGTFDPIHTGHLILTEAARQHLALHQVLFMPAGEPWLKAGHQITSHEHRLRMVKLAIERNRHFRVSAMELERVGPTYTVDTLQELRRTANERLELYVILGLDALNEVVRWRCPDRVLDLATLVGLARPGHRALDRAALESIRPGTADGVILVDGPLIGIDATDIRQRVSQGRSVKYMVPDAVEAYIREQGLYQSHGDR